MTNIEGLELLFVALGLFAACVTVGTFLLVSRWWSSRNGDRSRRRTTVLSGLAIVLSVVAWLYALVFVTPAGIVDHLADGNPVLIVLLVVYSLPAVLGGYHLSSDRLGRRPGVIRE